MYKKYTIIWAVKYTTYCYFLYVRPGNQTAIMMRPLATKVLEVHVLQLGVWAIVEQGIGLFIWPTLLINFLVFWIIPA
jgi:hypothetical protein